MNLKLKCPGSQVDPGRRMVQLALKEAMCSKLSATSSFKREFDKKKKDKWKYKRENCQEVMKGSLISSELPEIIKKIEEHKANINNVEKNLSSGCTKAPKGRGRGKPLSNHPGPSGVLGETLEADIHASELQDYFNRKPSDKVEEITNKTVEHKTSIKVIETKMPYQNEKVLKGRGRGRGKPPSNQLKASVAFVTKSETSVEPPTPLHRQFFSSSENDISFTLLKSSSMGATVCKAKAPLHSSYSDSLDSNFIQKSDTSNLLASDDDFSNLSHTKDMRQKNENFFFSNAHFSSQTLSDQGYSSCSSLFLNDNKFLNLPENETFINNQQISPNSDHSSSSSLFSCGNKINLKKKENLLIRDQTFSHCAGYQDCPNLLSVKNIISEPKPTAIINVCGHKEAISKANKCGISKIKSTDLFNEQSKSHVDFPDLSASQNESPNGLLSTLSNQFHSAVVPKSVICDNDVNELDLKSSCIEKGNIFVPKYNGIESEDDHINELIDSFINKSETKHIVEPIIDKSVSLSTDESDIQYIDELIDSFIDKSGDKHSNNFIDSFMDDPEDAYIDELINSFISKSNVLNENTNFNIAKEVASLDVPSDILSLLSLD